VVTCIYAEPEVKGTPTELAQYLPGIPAITSLTGEGELKVPADRAVISLNVVTENKSLQEATRLNQELRAKMIRLLDERGIPADRVQPSKFSSTPKYGLFAEKAKSYRVENVMKIKAEDEKEFQAVAGLVDAFSEVRYDSVEFEHSDKAGLKKRALELAIDKVTEKKLMYEEKLGVKLLPKSFSEGGVTASPSVLRNAYMNKLSSGYSGKLPESGRASAAGEVDVEEVPTSFGEMIFIGRVTVDYAVSAK
jgi:uncharacterized protein YggE